jgi:hypothetical protein
MSKTWEHFHHAARHHEKASYHYHEAAKFNQAEEHEKAAHHAYLAHGHSQHAVRHETDAAKLHAVECSPVATPVSEQASQARSAA